MPKIATAFLTLAGLSLLALVVVLLPFKDLALLSTPAEATSGGHPARIVIPHAGLASTAALFDDPDCDDLTNCVLKCACLFPGLGENYAACVACCASPGCGEVGGVLNVASPIGGSATPSQEQDGGPTLD